VSKLTDAIRAGVQTGVGLAGAAIVASATMALPILKLPIISHVFKWLVNWVISRVQVEPALANFIVDLAIDLQVNAEKAAYEKASAELKEILKRPLRTLKEVENASQEFDRRLADFIRIRP